MQERLARLYFGEAKIDTSRPEDTEKYLRSAREIMPICAGMIVRVKGGAAGLGPEDHRQEDRLAWAPVFAVHADGSLEVGLPIKRRTKKGTELLARNNAVVLGSDSDDFALSALLKKGVLGVRSARVPPARTHIYDDELRNMMIMLRKRTGFL